MPILWNDGKRILALWLMTCWPVSGQSDDTKLFEDVIEVRVIELEVVVTDKDGHRVTGLGLEDFQITAGGRAYPTDYFAEVREGEFQDGPQSGSGDERSPGSQGTSLLVFIDEVFPIGRDRNLALDQLIETVSMMGSNEQMAVVAFNGKQPETLTDWTRSPDALHGVFKKAKKRMARGLVGKAREKTIVLTFAEPPSPGQHTVYKFALKMRQRKYDMVIAIYDPISRQLSWTRMPLKL